MTDDPKAGDGLSWDSRERRRFSRYRHMFRVSYRVVGRGAELVQARADNLSIAGILMVTPMAVPVHALLEVTIVNTADGSSVEVRGVATRCEVLRKGDSHVVGVEFVDTTQEDSEQIFLLLPTALQNRSPVEMRRHVRLNCALPLWVKTSWLSRWRAASVVNLGAGGLMYMSKAEAKAGKRLKLRLKLPGQPVFTIAGRTTAGTSAEADGAFRVSVCFGHTTAAARRAIGLYVAHELLARQGKTPVLAVEEVPGPGAAFKRIGIAAAVAVVCALAASSTGEWLNVREAGQRMWDIKLCMRGRRHAHPAILILAVDNESVLKLAKGDDGSPEMARADDCVLANLKRWGASVVGFCRHYRVGHDVDGACAKGEAPGKVVRGFYRGAAPPRGQAAPAAVVGDAVRWGFLDLFPDLDMTVRRACVAAGTDASFALAVAEAYTSTRLSARSGQWHFRRIDYRGPVGTYPTVPYWQAASGDICEHILRRHGVKGPGDLFRGKIVLVGPMDAGTREVYATPFSGVGMSRSSAVEIHANLVDNLVTGHRSQSLPGWAYALVLFAAGAVGAGAFLSLRPWLAGGVLALDIALVVSFSVWAWVTLGITVSHVAPSACALAAAGLATASRMRLSAREKQFAMLERRELKARQERHEGSLARARDIVQSLLPNEKDIPFPDRLGVSVSFRPTDRVGGDMFDLRQIGPDRLAVVFADVTGHGIGAALMAAMVKSLGVFLEDHVSSPASFVRQANRNLSCILPEGMFVAVFYAVIDLEQQTIEYSNAGHHPLPVLLPSDGTPWQTLSAACGFVVGVDDQQEYESASVHFGSGDTLLMCSDGVGDGRCVCKDGEPLPEEMLAIAGDRALSVDQVTREIVRWTLRTPKVEVPEDDETILVIRRI